MGQTIREEARLDPALEALGRGDPEAWRAFLPTLRRIADELAPSFRDVSAGDDVLGDLALLAHERWIAEWIERARRGEARASLALFLRDRMRDRLREERRRRARRSALLEEAGEAIAAPEAPYPAPDELLAARELRARATGGDGALETVIAFREQGLDQREIAARVRTSRATIARRLALIGALIAPVIAGAVLLAWSAGREATEASIAPAPERAPAPAGTGEVLDPSEHVGTGEVLDPSEHVGPVAPSEPRAPRGAEVRGSWSRRAPVEARARAARGRLLVNSTPWSRVTIDGRAVGSTPLIGVPLAAGTHVVVLATEDGRTHRQQVVIRDGETVRLVHHF